MKKIISLFAAFAMICTMLTTVAFADDNNKFYIEKSVDGTNVTLTFGMLTNQTITSASGTLDATAALAACDDITFAKDGATTFTVNKTQKVIAWTLADTAGQSGDIVLGTVTFVNVKSTFELPLKRAFVAKDDTKTSVVDSFTNEQVGFVVEAAGPDRADSFVKSIGKFEYAGLTKPFVKATVGSASKDFYLPNDVVGGTTEVYGIFKYDAEDIAAGTTVTFELWDRGATAAAQSLGSIVAE